MKLTKSQKSELCTLGITVNDNDRILKFEKQNIIGVTRCFEIEKIGTNMFTVMCKLKGDSKTIVNMVCNFDKLKTIIKGVL